MPIVEGSPLTAALLLQAPVISTAKIIASATLAAETPIDISNNSFTTAGGGGADVFANWTETKAGSSTINRDTTNFNSSPASCRFDIGGSGSFASVDQNFSTHFGKRIRVVFQGKASASGKTIYIHNATQAGQAGSGNNVLINFTLTTSWAEYTATFDYRSYLQKLSFNRGTSASSSLWFDDVQVWQQNTLNVLGYVGYVIRVRTASTPINSLVVNAPSIRDSSAKGGIPQLTQIGITALALQPIRLKNQSTSMGQITILSMVTGTKGETRRRVFLIT